MFKEGELHMQQYPVRTIDLEALRENVRLLRSTLPEKTKLMAVVKADAYGHGIAKVARAALEAGASALAVARTDEGAALRQAASDVKSGDYAAAQKILEPVMQTPEASRLVDAINRR